MTFNFRPRHNKYGNERTIVDGKSFASRREANRYMELVLLQRAGRIEGLECQVRMPLNVNNVVVSHYVADFVYRENGQLKIEDSKGFRTDIYRLKAKMVKAQYGVEITET